MEKKAQQHSIIWALVSLVIIVALVAGAGMILLGRGQRISCIEQSSGTHPAYSGARR